VNPHAPAVLVLVLKLAARLPLRVLHGLGAVAGELALRFGSGFARKIDRHLEIAGLARDDRTGRLRRRSVAREIGKGAFELPAVWFRPTEASAALVTAVHGWQHVDAARAAGRGVLFLTPHLGCFEAAAIHAAVRVPITVLYRPPKLAWLEPLMRAGRGRGLGALAPTTLGGVRQLLRALRAGEAVGLLPDHVPGFGEGVWAPFFGHPAYTMTLAGRLQQATGCVVLLAFARRLPRGAGYRLTLEPIDANLSGPDGTARLNAALEALIRRCPEQYLWSYNRYKVPAGVTGPDATATTTGSTPGAAVRPTGEAP
jgi:KDO2-lipid IV(A) lauroyltransferase